MCREIKFRTYDSYKKKMFFEFHLTSMGIAWRSNEDPEENYPEAITGPVMQFTGLKDKKGVDIYDGDIIDISNGELFIVYWDNKYDFCFKKSDTNTGYYKTYRGATRDDGWTVIGNIYQHPELLNTESGVSHV